MLEAFFPPADRKVKTTRVYNIGIVVVLAAIATIGAVALAYASVSIGKASKVEAFNPKLYRSWRIDDDLAYNDCRGACPKQLSPPSFNFLSQGSISPAGTPIQFDAFGTFTIPKFYPTSDYCVRLAKTAGFSDLSKLISETTYSYGVYADEQTPGAVTKASLYVTIGSHVAFSYSIKFVFENPTDIHALFLKLGENQAIQSFEVLSGTARRNPNPIVYQRYLRAEPAATEIEVSSFGSQLDVASPEGEITALVRQLIFKQGGFLSWTQSGFEKICKERMIPQDIQAARFLNTYTIKPSFTTVVTQGLAAVNTAFLFLTFLLFQFHKKVVPRDDLGYYPIDTDASRL